MNWDLVNESMDWITTNTSKEEIPFEEVDWENWLEV